VRALPRGYAPGVTWTQRLLAVAGVAVVAWVCVTSWPAVVHGHPLYGVLLLATLVVSCVALWRARRTRPRPRGWRLAGRIVLAVLAVAWIAAIAWLRPFSAAEPALTSMVSTDAIRVTETATSIVMAPASGAGATGILFQPGAKVEARAYAAVLRPLAEAGFTVVIPKQPLGIAFLATGAFEAARDAFPGISNWIVGGHSLGGTVAAIDAEQHGTDDVGPVTGLMLYASYPASDMSTSLDGAVVSISGTEDGLATPADIEASRADLPSDAQFVAVEGAVHAFFGDYGEQPGDGRPTVSHDAARAAIAAASLDFVSGPAGDAPGHRRPAT
jgi:pimeloyl-ACP methyl ester carboxylesterase